MREKFGGLDGFGSPLKAGDLLPCAGSEADRQRQVPPAFIPDYTAPLSLRVIENRPSDLFSDQQIKAFYQRLYQVSAQSNQMGIRLEGPGIKPQQAGIISEGMPFGAIQIPPDGQPIVLLKDRQTIGGYPVLGSVLAVDAFLLAQQQAGTTIRFQSISLPLAQQITRDFYQFFM